VKRINLALQVSATLEASPAYLALDAVTRISSPYATFGGLIDNPLRGVVRQLRFDKVCDTEFPALSIGATKVRTGKIRAFSGDAIGTEPIPAIRFVLNLLATGRMPQGAMKRVLVQMISDGALMNNLGVATKTIPTAVILSRLKSAGRAAAGRFLDAHFDDLGRESTVDLAEMLG